jgi:hypothetical protein
MISLKRIKINTNPNRVKRALKKGSFNSLGQAAGTIRRIAMNSIKQSPKKEPAPVGKPPRTRFGQLKKSIRFIVDKEKSTVVVGPGRSAIALVGAVHEHGRKVQGKPLVHVAKVDGVIVRTVEERGPLVYPQRSFMAPAFEKVRDRLPKFWADSLKEG